MKTRGKDFIKNCILAVLMAYFIATAMPWVNTRSAVCAGFLGAELVMYFTTAADEYFRQKGRRRK